MENIFLKYIISMDSQLDSVDNLINVLQSMSSLEIKTLKDYETKNQINSELILKKYNSKHNFVIQKVNIKSKNKKQYFILKFNLSDICLAEKLNRELNIIISNFNGANIDLLNDGISKYYSIKAYEKLHSIENMIRSFITEMMLFYGEPDWVKKDAKEILNLLEKDVSKGNKILYSRNFDQLREFLFTDYSDNSYKEIVEDVINYEKNEKVSNLIKFISPKIPQTNWNKLLKSKAKEKNISGDHYNKLLENIYGMRNKIAHCNEFRKSDYDKFNEDCDELIRLTKIIINIVEYNNDVDILEDTNINNDISAIFSPLDTFNTIIVPAKEDGFKKVFLGEDMWYSIAIYNGRIDYIKYIAAYRTYPIKKITHYAVVDRVESSPYDEKKKIIYFKNKSHKLKNPIVLGKDKNAFQRSRYTTFDKLMNAKTTDDLF